MSATERRPLIRTGRVLAAVLLGAVAVLACYVVGGILGYVGFKEPGFASALAFAFLGAGFILPIALFIKRRSARGVLGAVISAELVAVVAAMAFLPWAVLFLGGPP